jgi:hypothetical protein
MCCSVTRLGGRRWSGLGFGAPFLFPATMPETPDQRVKRQPVEHTPAPVLAEQTAKLRRLFPNAISEGKIDFDKLRATLGDAIETRAEPRLQPLYAGGCR